MIAEQWRNAYATQKNETANEILQYTKYPSKPQEKATATAWRISEDFAKRVSAKPRSAPCRLLRNWVCFMQRRAVVLRARTRVHLYQRLRHV